jgi:hypothetical protein
MKHEEPRRWITSSYSGDQGNCVEVSRGQMFHVRDTKQRDGGELTVPARAWEAFTAAITL